MATKTIQPTRIQRLNDDAPRAGGDHVLYWMQQAQRAECNHALEYAIQRANDAGVPLLCVFGLTDAYPDANLRHYRFMLEGLRETAGALERRGIRMVVELGDPAEVALAHAGRAVCVVCDRGYTRHQKAWRARVAAEAGVEVVQVETDVVVPVEDASDKAEYAARTLRPKLHERLDRYLVELRTTPLDRDSLALAEPGLALEDVDAALDRLDLDRSVPSVERLYRGGTSQGRAVLRRFVDEHLDGYDEHRNRPETDYVSHMAAYLHFGQLSPLQVALAIRDAGAPAGDRDSYLEELIVRRELCANFVHFTPDYDDYRCLPAWARKTLAAHADDPREHVYTRAQLEAAETHDPYWNAAMREMVHTGYMHNYMRMYWGKKILQWTNTPQYAFRITLELNNKYFVDGRDCASFAGVAWIYGLHDRPWQERSIFGTVRYMSRGGLERKCDPDAYVAKVDDLVAKVRG